MILGHHLIWTAYGWWLPNDPRGSESHEIRVEKVAELGELYHGRKKVQPRSAEIRHFYQQARDVLQHPLLTFSEEEVALLAVSFGRVIAERGYTCYACAIMPDHVHLLVRRHRERAETMLAAFQAASRQAMVAAERRGPTHPVWGGPRWKVFLNTRKDIERVVRYTRANPVKIGRPEQTWDFVRPYEGWTAGLQT